VASRTIANNTATIAPLLGSSPRGFCYGYSSRSETRLINRWCSAVSELPIGRLPLYGIRHFVSDPNVKAVQKFGLYADDSDERRDRQIIDAWCQHDDGRPRQ
jgi:hypothetical protein